MKQPEKRECGSCALCCRIMGVPEVKEDWKWCPHCKPGQHACQIYADRPQRCREFNCQWLIDTRFGAHWYPKTSKIVVDSKIDPERNNRTYVYFVVDPVCPTRWKEEPYYSDIKKVARAGLTGSLGHKWVTIITIKDERIVVLQ